MRKGFKVFLMGFLLLSCIWVSGRHVAAASQKSKALKAYKTFLDQSTVEWDGNGKTISVRKCRFALAYIDNDNIPELILNSGSNINSHADGYYALYTYKNGKVRFVINLMDDFSYYKKKGIFCSIHSGTGGYECHYLKLSKGNITYKFYSQDEVGWDIDGDGKIGMNYKKITKSKTPYYNSPAKKISKASFNKGIKRLVGKTKNRRIKTYYTNTALNRAKYLK